MRILLMGNPNVGKSVIFSRLTGTLVITSNYPGTTVEYTKGAMKFKGRMAEVIDVPGVYSLDVNSKAEEVAVKMLREGDLVINVVDATNLERNLYLTLQLLELGVHMVIALNFWDEAKHKGISIDREKLERLLGVPVVPTVAVTGEGIKELVSRLPEATVHKTLRTDEERWVEVGRITSEVQTVTHRHHTFLESLGDASIHPATGIPILVGVMLATFYSIRTIGEGLISYFFEPLFDFYMPFVRMMSEALGPSFVHEIVVGKLIDGEVDYVQSMGLLTTGLYVPFAMVLPYVFAFYLVLGVIEDVGYLPRLAVLVDTFTHRVGLHGVAVIPMILGLGCNVPGVLSARILETKRQRFIASTLMVIAVPCMAQLAIIFGLVGPYGLQALATVFITLSAVWVVLGVTLNKVIGGESPEMFLEIPPYRFPYWGILLKKLWLRMKLFITEAIPYVLLGVLIVNLFYTLGVIDFIGKLAAPAVVGLLGLPKGAVAALVIGFLRKDVAVGMLLPLGLTSKQTVVASVVLAMYYPCIATFVVLVKELGVKDTLKSATIMVSTSLLVGGLLNLILGW
ncbi:MAG: ferrous iron transporter B [Candidatus Bathyarchaeia archaeon]